MDQPVQPGRPAAKSAATMANTGISGDHQAVGERGPASSPAPAQQALLLRTLTWAVELEWGFFVTPRAGPNRPAPPGANAFPIAFPPCSGNYRPTAPRLPMG